MIVYSTANTPGELQGILTLQRENLARNLDAEEIKEQGFVTVEHGYALLEKLNSCEKHILAKDGQKVIGYLLAMTKDRKNDVPVLLSMFDAFDRVKYDGRKIADYHYLVVGQVCVARPYRGQGILDACYAAYRKHYHRKYDFAITEIDATNLRSLQAHKRIGFIEAERYNGPDGTNWVIVLWDWRESKR
ncbi:MAG: GNAT family N-acetyltransferase [Bacteroidetes bacterium]|nr:GNAT family N-acetyltransferase [Bacteroidota bacterium]